MKIILIHYALNGLGKLLYYGDTNFVFPINPTEIILILLIFPRHSLTKRYHTHVGGRVEMKKHRVRTLDLIVESFTFTYPNLINKQVNDLLVFKNLDMLLIL